MVMQTLKSGRIMIIRGLPRREIDQQQPNQTKFAPEINEDLERVRHIIG